MASDFAPGLQIGSAVSPAASRVIEILGDYTAFPHALLVSVCERQKCEVGALSYADVPALIHALALQIALFNDVDAAFAAKRRLLLVGRRASSGF
jgi:hypothetical protein